MRAPFPVWMLAMIFASAACHQQPAREGAAPPPSSQNVITRAEIEACDAHNVYDLVARLRGQFLKDRGRVSLKTNTHSQAVVFLNDQEYGVLETMRNIPVERIELVRYLSGPDAVARYGSQYGGGVVLLISRVE